MAQLQHLGRIGFQCMLQGTILHWQVGGRDNLIGGFHLSNYPSHYADLLCIFQAGKGIKLPCSGTA